MADKEWKGSMRGAQWMHRTSVWMLRWIPLPVMYAFIAVFVMPWVMLFAHKGYICQYHYFRRRRAMGAWRAFWHTYKNHCLFSQVVMDHFYMYGGGRFEVSVTGYDTYRNLAEGKDGFVILSAHVGNYEIAGYTLVADKKRFNALVFGGETQMVMKNRQQLFAQHNIRMIPIKEDMSHIFELSNALAAGETVSLAGDRIFGAMRAYELPFMGAEAKFPMGPFALAAQREVPVIAVNVLKVGCKHYHIYVQPLQAEGKTVKQRARNLAEHYVANLELVLNEYPDQWYNYYEFWNQ